MPEIDALQKAQDHCRSLQEEYRRLISEGTVIKADKFKCEKEYFRASEERTRWEKELAEAEVETLLLSEDLKSIKEHLQELSRFAQDSASLRAQLSASDRAVREETSSKTDYLMHLPDEFYSGALQVTRKEILSLQHCLAEAREQEEERGIVEARLAVTVQENEQLVESIKKCQAGQAEAQQKLSAAETELDCMAYAREETLSDKRDELENRNADLTAVGSHISEREAQVRANRDKEANLQREIDHLKNSAMLAHRQITRRL